MFGSEYAKKPNVLVRLMRSEFGIQVRMSWLASVLSRIYVNIFGVPEVGFRIRGAHFQREMKRLQPHHILDAGCGLGAYSFWLARRFPNANIDAIDVNSEMIATAEHIRKHLNLRNIRFEVQPVEAIKAKKRYDLIVLVDVLEHLEDDAAVLTNIFDALLPGGHLYLHVPHSKQLRHFSRFRRWEDKSHVREGYAYEDLLTLLRGIGFIVLDSRFTHGWWASLAWELNQLTLTRLPLAAIIFPLLMLFVLWDAVKRNRAGNCIMVLARK